jgi:hypothetical protein
VKNFSGVLVLMILPAAGCVSGPPSPILDTRTELKSSDGLTMIKIPQGWTEDKELHQKAELQASDRAREEYIIVLSESKEDFQQMTLEKHSETTRGSLLNSLTNPEVSGPTMLTINGSAAIQYEIRGTIQNMNIVYLHTTIETPENFHQVLAWTLKSRFEKNQTRLRDAINSFQEVVGVEKK